MKRIFSNMFDKAYEQNRKNILELVDGDSNARLVDLGCDDGAWTEILAKKIGTDKYWGLDINQESLTMAQKRGVRTVKADLKYPLPFKDGFFDVVHANQVIEHVPDVDLFLSEINRILKSGGYAIISTENGSSWHNILAALFGWQIFSLTNVSALGSGIGNPLALHRAEKSSKPTSWTHKTIFNFLGLKEIMSLHGFKHLKLAGAGYYPLPAQAGKIDIRHAHFITIRASK